MGVGFLFCQQLSQALTVHLWIHLSSYIQHIERIRAAKFPVLERGLTLT